jgi:hypothetical protein
MTSGNINELKASELRAHVQIKKDEYNKAEANGLPYTELSKLYKEIKDLEYQVTMMAVPFRDSHDSGPTTIVSSV